MMEVLAENEEPHFEPSDNEDVSPETHSKLLNAVTQIYRKQRIDQPIRREPALQISEFNLSNKTTDDGGKLVDVHELVSVLNERAAHHEIKKKVKTMQQKSKPLPQPLEKLHADKLRRKLGYVSVKRQLNRWEATVQRNRAALQLRFPLERNEKVKVSHDFMKTFKEPTELEKQVAAILQTSETAQEERRKEEELFPLSLEEIIERRKMIARMRVRESYRIAKAIRQNKIKSKKYHRILKKERIKKELKDFEILQKTNPEAALEKLDKIERARAEERISLRHRNTGKWAKSRAIRAKYDTEARAQLAEQLAKSRDLTRRVQASIDSNSEADDDDDGNEAGKESLLTDPTNPWKSVAESAEAEIESFVEGFKQYQEEKKNETLQNNAIKVTENKAHPKDTSNVTSSNVQDGDAFNSEKPENLDCVVSSNEETSIRQCFSERENLANEDDQKLHEEHPSEVNQRANNHNTPPATQIFAADDLESLNACSDEVGSVALKNSDEEKTALRGVEEDKISAQLSIENRTTLQLQQKLNPSNKSKRKVEPEVTVNSYGKKTILSNIEITNRTNENVTINLQQRSPKIISSECEFQNNGSESEITLINKIKKSKLKKQLNLVNQSGIWEVSSVDASKQNSIETCNNENISTHKINTIDKIFDNAEHKLKSTVSNHISELKSNLSNENDNSEKIKKSKYHADLSMKSRGKRLDIDTALIEVANEGISTGENDVKTLLNLYDTNKNSTKNEVTNIDPHKFLPVKPQKLNSGQLDLVEDHNESEDEELVDKNRKLNLEEAFADDDVIEEFRREKEKDIERSNPKDIDLTLPGWGHWAGCSMEPRNENRRKRKNRRLIIEFPKIPRKDDKKDYVIINEDVSNNLKKHMVHDLPFPFKSVKDYETSIRAPIGNTWVPQSAFMKFIQPSVLTRLGSIIEPMNETERSNFKKRKVQKK